MTGTTLKQRLTRLVDPERWYVSQIDSRTVGIFERGTNKQLDTVSPPPHIDCRCWAWHINENNELEIKWTDEEQMA